jgi:Zn-dependent peptidase ImmA (M78 family)
MAGTGRDLEERYANAFAAELLVPVHLVEELSAHMGAVGIEAQAVLRRLRDQQVSRQRVWQSSGLYVHLWPRAAQETCSAPST